MRRTVHALTLVAVLSFCSSSTLAQSVVPRISVADDGFVTADSGDAFTPWGFNYDRDWNYRLIEDFWGDEWEKLEEDFGEMHDMGANVVRIHLQYHRFMDGPTAPNEINLSRLRDLVILAESLGMYLDITGLGSYRPDEDPAWYSDLSEPERWAAQAAFWEAIAEALADRPGVFAFNLMNEPITRGSQLERGVWVVPYGIEGLYYVHYINLDLGGRDSGDIAVAWVRQMKAGIRKHDPQRLITVGLFPIAGAIGAGGFSPARLAEEVDFISVHLYPEAGRVREAVELLRGYDVGLPILIEETFPLNSGLDEYRNFLSSSHEIADGWITFYWGEPADALLESDEPAASLVLGALTVFAELRP